MKKNNNRKKHENRKKKKEFAFVLGLPLVFNRGTVGQVVQEFTNIDLRCMSVTRKFIEAHFQKKGRYTFTGPVMEFVTDGPFLAMKLQGVDAVKRAFEHVSITRIHPLWDRWPLVYCSDTVQSAQEDANQRANQRFVLIKPKAVREGIMPELLASIERIRCYVKGLKLVKKSEVPRSVAWSDDGSSSLDATRKK